jgi:hypothetical protein
VSGASTDVLPHDSPSANTDLTSWRLSHTGLDDVAHVDLLDLVGLDARPLKCMLDGGDTELGRGDGGERTVDRSDGGTRRTDYVDALGGLRVSGAIAGGKLTILRRYTDEGYACCFASCCNSVLCMVLLAGKYRTRGGWGVCACGDGLGTRVLGEWRVYPKSWPLPVLYPSRFFSPPAKIRAGVHVCCEHALLTPSVSACGRAVMSSGIKCTNVAPCSPGSSIRMPPVYDETLPAYTYLPKNGIKL